MIFCFIIIYVISQSISALFSSSLAFVVTDILVGQRDPLRLVTVAGPQYTQFTGTHWGSLHSLSTAACNVSKALSRLSLTMVRSK